LFSNLCYDSFYAVVFDNHLDLMVPAMDKRLVDMPLLPITSHRIDSASADADLFNAWAIALTSLERTTAHIIFMADLLA
jgi:hypothetical protein